MSEKSRKTNPFKDAIDITLSANIDVVRNLIATKSRQLKFENYIYRLYVEKESDVDKYSKFLVIAIWEEGPEHIEDDIIGVFSLHWTKEDQTWLNVPPANAWFFIAGHDELRGRGKTPGRFGPDDFNQVTNQAPFLEFIKFLINEFPLLGIMSIKGDHEILESKKIATDTARETLPEDSTQIGNLLFNKMQFHPLVVEASKSLFESRHYYDAIFAAYKAIDNFVKKKTGLSIYGEDLMGKVFNKDNPIIKLNELRTLSNRNEQKGFMYLFQGAMLGIRNPKAHDEATHLDPYKTLEYLGFASLLMRRAEEGKLIRTRRKQRKSTQS